jgi:hypothetical protein
MADQAIVQNFAMVPAGDMFENYETRVYAYQHVAHIYNLAGHDFPDPAQMRFHAFLLVRITRTSVTPDDQYELHYGDCRFVHKGRMGELPYWLAPEWSGTCVIDPRKGLKSCSFSYLGADGLQRDQNFTTMLNVPQDLELATGWHNHRAWSVVFRRRDLERGGAEHAAFSTWVNGLRRYMEPVAALEFPSVNCDVLALEYSRM